MSIESEAGESAAGVAALMRVYLRQYGPVLLLLVLMAIAQLSGLLLLLDYDRVALQQGQWWRLLSAHLVHLNTAHALMNAAALVLVAFYFSRWLTAGRLSLLVLVSALLISAGLWWWTPSVPAYAGFSGVLHALLYAGLCASLRHHPWLHGGVLLLALARLGWEHSAFYDPYYLQNVVGSYVVPDAHLYGALTGMALGLFWLWQDRSRQS